MLLGKRKASVALIARRKDRIQQAASEIVAAGGKAVVIAADVGNESEMQEAVAWTNERLGRIDVLINNAGTGLLAEVQDTSTKQLERVLRTNFWGTFYGIRSVLPIMKKQGSGQIISVASMSGRRGAPLKSAYCASKFAQIGLMESLRMELYGTDILCTLIFPGATETDFFDSTENPSGHPYKLYGGVQKPAQVAEAIVDSIGRRDPEVITQKMGRVHILVHAASPSLADWLVSRRKTDIMGGTKK